MRVPPSTAVDRLTRRQLRTLLEIAARPATPAEAVAEAASPREAFVAQLAGIAGEAETTFWDMLRATLEPTTTVALLREIKDRAKHLQSQAEGDRPRAAAMLLYHLAVAAALGYHGVNISSRSPRVRMALYGRLATSLQDSGLAAVFTCAVERMDKHAG